MILDYIVSEVVEYTKLPQDSLMVGCCERCDETSGYKRPVIVEQLGNV
jgi:hypothetical protein